MEYEVYVTGAYDADWGNRAVAAIAPIKSLFVSLEDDDGMWRGTVSAMPNEQAWIEQTLLGTDDDIEVHITYTPAPSVSFNAPASTSQQSHNSLYAGSSRDTFDEHGDYENTPHYRGTLAHLNRETPYAVVDADANYARIQAFLTAARAPQYDAEGNLRSFYSATTAVEQWNQTVQPQLTSNDIPTLITMLDELDNTHLATIANKEGMSADYLYHLNNDDALPYTVLFNAVWTLAQSRSAAPFIPNMHQFWYMRAVQRREIEWKQMAAQAGMSYTDWKQKAEDRLRADIAQKHLTVRASSASMMKILHSGRLKSQFETGSSAGAHAPMNRAENEMWLHGVPPSLRHRRRMTYGYLSTGEDDQETAQMYGDVRMILKPDVAATTTWIGGDSLGLGDSSPSYVNDMMPSPVVVPDLVSLSRAVNPVIDNPLDIEDEYHFIELQFHRDVTVGDIAAIVHETYGYGDNEEEQQRLQSWCAEHGVPYVFGSPSDTAVVQAIGDIYQRMPSIGSMWSHLTGAAQ